MPNNVVETIFRFKADRAASAEVLRSNQQIDAALADIEQGARRVEAAYSDVEHAGVKASQARIEALKTEIRIVREQADLYGNVGRHVGIIGARLSTFGGAALGGQMMMAADMLDLVEASQLMKAELPALAAQLGIGRKEIVALGAAGIGLAASLIVAKAALSDLADASQRLKGLVGGQIEAYRKFHDFISTATSEQLKAEIEATMQRDLADRAYYADILALQGRVKAALDEGRGINLEGLAEGAIQLYESLGGNVTGLKDIEAALNDAQKSMEQNRLYLNLLVQAYTEGAAAANDAAERERLYTDRKITGIEAQIQREAEFQRLIEAGSSQDVEARLQAIDQEQASIQKLIAELEPLAGTSETAATKLADARNRLAELQLEAQGLSQNVLPAIRAVEQWRSGLERFKAGIQQTIQTVADISQKLQAGAGVIAKYEYQAGQIEKEAAQEREQIEARHYARLADLQEQSQQRQAEAYQRYQDSIVEMEKGLEESLGKMRADYQRDEMRREQDFRRDRERAERQHKTSLLEAASRLDATAVLQEQRRYAEEERQAQEDFQLETQRRKEDLQLREQQERESLKKRLEQAQKAYDEQLRREREQLQRSIAQQNAAYRAELQQLDAALRARLLNNQNAMQAELGQLYNWQHTEYVVRESHYAALKAQLDRWFGSQIAVPGIATTATRAATGITDAVRGVFSFLGRSFDSGGYTPGGLVMAHQGEFVLQPQTVKALEQGLGQPLTQQRIARAVQNSQIGPVTIQQSFGDIGQYTPQQIERIVHKALVGVFQQLGA